MSTPRKSWMEIIAPWSPFIVLALAAAVATYHVIFNW